MKRKIGECGIGSAWGAVSPLVFVMAIAVAMDLAISAIAPRALAQNIEGQIVAAQYGEYRVPGTADNGYTFSPSACQVSTGGRNFTAFTEGAPVRIVDGSPATSETVIAGLVDIRVCSVQLAPLHHHSPPFYLTSGTGGLQEAIIANSTGSQPAPNTIILNREWYALGGSAAIIGSVKGNAALSLVDITQTPYIGYKWNGTQYAAVQIGGGCGGGCVNTLNGISGGVELQADAGISITPAGNAIVIKNTGGAGVSSLNSASGNVSIEPGPSGTISVSAAGNAITIDQAGSVAAGGIVSGGPYNDTYYKASSQAPTVGPSSNSYTLPAGLSSAQINGITGALANSRIRIQAGDNHTPFTNPRNDKVVDERVDVPVAPRSVKEWGAQCDAQVAFGAVTAGSNVLNINNAYGYALSQSDAGDSGTNLGAKWISIVGAVAGIPTRFDAYITGVNSAAQATLSANAPFTSLSNASITIGHDDTAQLSQGVTAAHEQAVLSFPAAGVCWSRTGPVNVAGQSLEGQAADTFTGAILGGAGMDTLNVSGGNAGQEISHLSIYLDARIDAAQPWNYDNNGATSPQAAMYRPAGLMTPHSNDPLGPGWVRGSEPYGLGAYNGVASTTSGSAAICVLTGPGSAPPIGADIVFPYLTSVLHTTVVSTAGTCGTGTPVTLGAPVPQSIGQAEYFFGETPGSSSSGAAVQEIANAIPATGRSFPMTVTLKNPINPEPGAESDFAPFGLVKIDAEECTYYSTSSYPIQSGSYLQLTACAQNGTASAAHTAGAAIVPLNPCNDSLPWPVTTINGAGNQTPSQAEYYPAWCLGNAAFSQPVYDGTGWSGSQSLYRAHVHDLQIVAWPAVIVNSAENPYNFKVTNATAGMYIAALPFNTHFDHLNIGGAQFGIFETGASINTHNYFGLGAPTADTDIWDNIAINAGYDFDFLGGSTGTYSNLQLFSSNGPPATGWPGYPPASFTGAGVAGMWTALGPDDTSGLSRGQYSQPSECYNSMIFNVYLEGESGSLTETEPLWVMDCSATTWSGQGDISGGPDFIGGEGNHLSGALFNNGYNLPAIINSPNTTIDFATGLANTVIGNTWGTSSLLVYSPNTRVTGQGVGGDGRLSYGNNTAVVAGQTNEFANTGNTDPPYVNSQSGFFTAATLNPVGAAGSAIGWTFDGTAANITQGYSGCNTTPGSSTVQCTLFLNGATQQEPTVGPGQVLAAGKYIWTMGVRESSGAPQTFGAYVSNSCTGYIDTSHTAIPISTTWTNVPIGIVDFSGSTGCAISVTLNGTSSAPAQIEVGYISFAPLPQNLQAQQVTLPQTTPADNAACTPGAFLGSDGNYIYVCTASGTVKRTALSAY